MFQSEVLFKVSKLQVIEITNSSIQMNDSYITFYIEGTDSDTTYSFQFESFITIEELKQLEVDQEIDFQKYVLDNNVILGINKQYKTLEFYTMMMKRQDEEHFLLNIQFQYKIDIIGAMEISFSYKDEEE